MVRAVFLDYEIWGSILTKWKKKIFIMFAMIVFYFLNSLNEIFEKILDEKKHYEIKIWKFTPVVLESALIQKNVKHLYVELFAGVKVIVDFKNIWPLFVNVLDFWPTRATDHTQVSHHVVKWLHGPLLVAVTIPRGCAAPSVLYFPFSCMMYFRCMILYRCNLM